MSHVDDGILHAYLDGALDALSDAGELPEGTTAADVVSHLGTCADCRARLETERAVRENAGLVMRDLPLPGSYVPELPSLATARAHRNRWVPLGWAASLLLAVGAGWIGSDVWRADPASVQLESSGSTSPTQSAASGLGSAAATESSDARRPLEVTDATEASDARTPLQAMEASEPGTPLPPTDASEAGTAVANNPSPARDSTAAVAAAAAQSGGTDLAALDAARPRVEQIVASPPLASVIRPVESAFRPTAAEPAGMRVGLDPPGISSLTITRRSLPDAQKVLTGRMHAPVAFDTIIAREQSGRIHFADASPADLRALADQIFVIADASAPSIEAAREIGQTVVRVRQTMASGEQVELVTWRQHKVELDQLVITGTPADTPIGAQERRARSGAPEAGARRGAAEARSQQDLAPVVVVEVMRPRIRTLDDDRLELVLGTADASVWIAVRAHVSENELRALANRVTIQ